MGWFWHRRFMKRQHPTLVLGKGVRIAFPEHLVLGNHISIGRDGYLQAQGGITIGDHTILGSRVVILSHNHNYLTPTRLPYDEEEIVRPVVVGRYVWVGMGSMICPGTTVGDAAVVLMGSVVTKDVPPMAIVRGNPATVVGSRDEARTRELMEQECSFMALHKRPPEDL
jgi:acetyltransferase-like isoleucine patch superfamily enzyme